MSKKPLFVTFTGVDEKTDLERLIQIGRTRSVEFGVLFSKSGKTNRYPSLEWFNEYTSAIKNETVHVKSAAHICGKWARQIMEGGAHPPIPLTVISRVQVNHTSPNLAVLEDYSKSINRIVIAQSRDVERFAPSPTRVSQLFDASGGKGLISEQWPANTDGICGYAGGLTPDNVVEMNEKSRSEFYWLDMETGIRDDNDYFDLDKVERVLDALRM